MKIISKVIVLILVTQLCACGTYASMQKYGKPNSGPLVFGGTRVDIKSATKSATDPWLKKQPYYNPYVDMPFSAVADLVLLPFTITYVAFDCMINARC